MADDERPVEKTEQPKKEPLALVPMEDSIVLGPGEDAWTLSFHDEERDRPVVIVLEPDELLEMDAEFTGVDLRYE